MNRYEQFKTMSIEQLAKFLHLYTRRPCKYCIIGEGSDCYHKHPDADCRKNIIKYLGEERGTTATENEEK